MEFMILEFLFLKRVRTTNFIHGPIQRVPVVDVNSFPIITKAEYNNNFNNIEILFDKVDTNSVIRWKKKGENDWSDPIAAPALKNVTAGILLDGDVIQIQSGLVISPDFPPIYREVVTEVAVRDEALAEEIRDPYLSNFSVISSGKHGLIEISFDVADVEHANEL